MFHFVGSVRYCCCIVVVLTTFIFFYTYFKETQLNVISKEGWPTWFHTTNDSARRNFAVFGCSTPDSNSHRRFDYTFYLPLTVLAWQRIGFESIILIIGERYEWEGDQILSLVLEALDRLKNIVTVIFIPAKAENRGMLGQTARIFVSNMKDFPGRSTDFIVTSDADLWPLRKEHFYPPQDTDAADRPLFLVHSMCCGSFEFNGRFYTMLPMGHIGASASTWQQIINTNSHIKANDSTTILAYFQQVFGDGVYQSVQFASEEWFLDQKLVSIRIDEWVNRQTSKDIAYEVSDDGFFRINRISWESDMNRLQESSIKIFFDAHLVLNGFLAKNWASVKPLILAMYGKFSWQIDWIDQYATEFNTRFVTWKANQIETPLKHKID